MSRRPYSIRGTRKHYIKIKFTHNFSHRHRGINNNSPNIFILKYIFSELIPLNALKYLFSILWLNRQ